MRTPLNFVFLSFLLFFLGGNACCQMSLLFSSSVQPKLTYFIRMGAHRANQDTQLKVSEDGTTAESVKLAFQCWSFSWIDRWLHLFSTLFWNIQIQMRLYTAAGVHWTGCSKNFLYVCMDGVSHIFGCTYLEIFSWYWVEAFERLVFSQRCCGNETKHSENVE